MTRPSPNTPGLAGSSTLESSSADIGSRANQVADLTPAEAVEFLQADQLACWARGERIPAEAYLQRHPALADGAAEALDLVYGEFLIRRQRDEDPALEEYQQRFPQYGNQLRLLVEMEGGLSATRPPTRSPLECPACTKKLSGPNPAKGKPARCPECGHTRVVPTAEPAPQSDTKPGGLYGGSDESLPRTLRPTPRPPAPAVRPPLPDGFDDYELLEEVARGGMGVVYKARQLSLNRLVALKKILDGRPLLDDAVRRFHREAQAAATLDHPNIVAIYASGQHDGRPFFTMAYVEGDNLGEMVQRDGLPTPQRAADLLAAVADAIAFAHQHGIIHRDLKPENVLIDRQGRPRVTDFGLACQLGVQSTAERLTHAGEVLGTPAYMSPEQAMGKLEETGPATDVYGLGAILYFLLTGHPPFQARSMGEVLCRVIMDAPAPPRQLNPQAASELETVCLRCLEKDPARRYSSVEALAVDLRAAAARTDQRGAQGAAAGGTVRPAAQPAALASTTAPSDSSSPVSTGKKRWTRAGLAAVILVVLATGVGLAAMWWPERASTPGSADNGPNAQPAALPNVRAEKPLTPPGTLRTDFGLTVAMLGKNPAGGDFVTLAPAADGIRRLRTGESVKFQVQVARPAYVGIWSVHADGSIRQLFPNAWEKEHHCVPDKARLLPTTDAVADRSRGVDWVWVQASTHPWDPDQGERDGPFLLFKTGRERDQWAQRRRGIQLRPEAALAEAVLKYRVEP